MFNLKDVRPELEEIGFRNLGAVYWDASTPYLYEQIVRRREGHISHLGTAKVAGTEQGVEEPQATFSACFGKTGEDTRFGFSG